MFDWILNLVYFIGFSFVLACISGIFIGFGLHSLLRELHEMQMVRDEPMIRVEFETTWQPIEEEEPEIERCQAYHDTRARRLLKL